MENYVVYTMPINEYEQLKVGKEYVEVWKGLPEVDFEIVKSRGGYDSLRYQQDGNYIWVAYDAVEELRRNPQAILLIHRIKTNDDKINAWWVDKLSERSRH